MQIGLLTVATAVALVVGSVGAAPIPPPKPNVELRAKVSRDERGFLYDYEIRNLGVAPVTLDTLKVPVVGMGAQACAIEGSALVMSVPPRIAQPLEGIPVAIWSLFDKALAPGATLPGLRLRCSGVPAVQEVILEPSVSGYLGQLLTERLAAGQFLDNLEIKAIREGRRMEVGTLGPGAAAPGTWEHWDQFQVGLARTAELGWISDPAVLNEVQANVKSARAAAVAQDWTSMEAGLRKAIDAVSLGCCELATPLARDLVVLNAAILAAARPAACDPLLTITTGAALSPIGKPLPVAARLINRADQKPIIGRLVSIQAPAWESEDAVQMASRTDESGEAHLSFARLHEGSDTLTASTEPVSAIVPAAGTGELPVGGTSCEGYSVKSAPVRVAWSGGPNLVFTFFIGPMLISAPGRPFYVSDTVRNAGSAASPATTVRYYISTDRVVIGPKGLVAGQRRVPPLKPGEESTVDEGALTVPRELPAGTYYLEAEVDPDDRVVELDETDNLSSRGGGLMGAGFMAMGMAGGRPALQATPPPSTTPAAHARPLSAAEVPWVAERFIQPPRRSEEYAEEAAPAETPTPLRAAPEPPRLGDGEFLVKRTEINEAVLTAAIGVLGVRWEDFSYERVLGDPKCGPIQTFLLQGERFKPGAMLEVKALRPVYVFEERGASFLLPVVSTKDDFVEVVVDPVRNTRAWVSLAHEPPPSAWCLRGMDFTCMTCTLPMDDSNIYPIDPFILTGRGFRKLYSEPSLNAPWKILAPGATDIDAWNSLVVLEQRNGFLLVGAGGEIGGWDGRLLGWIPLRDEQGRLTVWVVFYWC